MENELPFFCSWSVSSQDLSKESLFRSATCKMFSRTIGPKNIFLIIKFVWSQLGCPPNLTITSFCGHGPSHPSGKNEIDKSKGGVFGLLFPFLNLGLPFFLWKRFVQHFRSVPGWWGHPIYTLIHTLPLEG